MNPDELPNAQPAPAEAPQPAPEFTPGIANAPQLNPEPAPQPEATPAVDPLPPAPGSTQEPAPQAAPATPVSDTPAAPAVDYDAYLDSLIGKANEAPTEIKMPTEEDFQKDEKALENFFSGLVDTAVQRSQAESQKQAVIREAETRAWDEVFVKYPEIKESKPLRDTIHNIRMGAYQRGQAMSPSQVADQLIGDLHREYKKGVNDTNVQTTIRSSQPTGGGSQQQPSPSVNYASLQDGGRNAAVTELEKLISQGLI